MPERNALHYRVMANRLILCVNIVLFAALAFSSLPDSDRSSIAARKDAHVLEMDIYCQKSPFAVLVHKDFPKKKRFAFFRYSRLLYLMSGRPNRLSSEAPHHDESLQHSEEAEEITLGFGKNFSISCSCVYSAANGIRVEDLRVIRVHEDQCKVFSDFNADGITDLRYVTNRHLVTKRQRAKDTMEIWYDGKWHDVVATGKKYQKQLPGGETVRFDMKRGRWLGDDE